jgi:hypothetical protein
MRGFLVNSAGPEAAGSRASRIDRRRECCAEAPWKRPGGLRQEEMGRMKKKPASCGLRFKALPIYRRFGPCYLRGAEADGYPRYLRGASAVQAD